MSPGIGTAARWRPTTAAARLRAIPSIRQRSRIPALGSRSQLAPSSSAGQHRRLLRSGVRGRAGRLHLDWHLCLTLLSDPAAVPAGRGPQEREDDRGDCQLPLSLVCDHRDLTCGPGEAPDPAPSWRRVTPGRTGRPRRPGLLAFSPQSGCLAARYLVGDARSSRRSDCSAGSVWIHDPSHVSSQARRPLSGRRRAPGSQSEGRGLEPLTQPSRRLST